MDVEERWEALTPEQRQCVNAWILEHTAIEQTVCEVGDTILKGPVGSNVPDYRIGAIAESNAPENSAFTCDVCKDWWDIKNKKMPACDLLLHVFEKHPEVVPT